MATGDLKNNLRKLQGELKAVNYSRDVDFESLGNGNTADYLPIYHYVFIEYSRPLSAKIAEINVELFGKTDLRFIESVYKVLREVFAYKPPVTKEQFFAPGFGERKVIMCTQILQLMRVKHQSLVGSSKSTSVKVRPSQSSCSVLPSSSPFANPETVTQMLPADSAGYERQSTGQVTPVIPLVVNETRTRPIQQVPVVSMNTNASERLLESRRSTVTSTSSSVFSLPDERRQTDEVLKNQLLEAFSKINGSIEQISSRLGILDHRLSRLESLEQRLAGLDRLETRVCDVEQAVSRNGSRETICPSPDPINSNKIDLISSQLNNLVARMTLVENKLIILQSAEVSAANDHPQLQLSGSNSPRLTTIANEETSHYSEVNEYINHIPAAATDAESAVCTAGPAGSLSMNEEESKSSRVEQLDRIQAMLRGTEEMLNINSSIVQQGRDPSPSLT